MTRTSTRQRPCTHQHRSYHALAKCLYPRAVWVLGDGPFVTLAWCRVLSVMCHESAQDAVQAKGFIDRLGCGGMCHQSHEIVVLDLTARVARPLGGPA